MEQKPKVDGKKILWKFDVAWNILPYIGKYNKWEALYAQLNKKSRAFWKQNIVELNNLDEMVYYADDIERILGFKVDEKSRVLIDFANPSLLKIARKLQNFSVPPCYSLTVEMTHEAGKDLNKHYLSAFLTRQRNNFDKVTLHFELSSFIENEYDPLLIGAQNSLSKAKHIASLSFNLLKISVFKKFYEVALRVPTFYLHWTHIDIDEAFEVDLPAKTKLQKMVLVLPQSTRETSEQISFKFLMILAPHLPPTLKTLELEDLEGDSESIFEVLEQYGCSGHSQISDTRHQFRFNC